MNADDKRRGEAEAAPEAEDTSVLLRAGVIALVVLAVLAVLWLLAAGKAIFVPIAIAVVIWYVIDALAHTFRDWGLNARLSLGLAVAVILGALVGVVNVVSGSVDQLIDAWPVYERNLGAMLARVYALVGQEPQADLASLLDFVDVTSWFGSMAGAVSGFAGNFGLILVYIIFLLVSQQTFQTKLDRMITRPDARRRVAALVERINRKIHTYLRVKTVVSVATGLISYAILAAVGVDFAVFWAFLVFLLNYIPTIGPAVAVLFPALLTLIQFESPTPFLLVTPLLTATQFVIGNIIEPRYMGDTLNIDPLVVMITLVVWGSLWGVTGMFLAVPITVMLLIILAEFRATRWIVILLSRDGEID